MTPSMRLKLGAIFFAVSWSLGMIWWGGIYTLSHVASLSLCGVAAAYGWYRLMRWQLPHEHPPRR